MNGDKHPGREYAEIWGEAVRANRKLRTILVFLSGNSVLGVLVLLRLAGPVPPRPIVVRIDEVWRAEALAYEAATAQADPPDPTTKSFLNRFVHDFHSRHRTTVEEHWTRSRRFLSTELGNVVFQSDSLEATATAAGTAESEREVEQVVLRIHPAPEPPHGAMVCTCGASGRSGANAGRSHPGSGSWTPSRTNSSSTTRWASSSLTSGPTGRS